MAIYHENSLTNKMIGIAAGASLAEFNLYAESHPEQFQAIPYHSNYFSQQIIKLETNRIDAFLFTKNTTNYNLKLLGQQANFRNAGCTDKTPLYMAFTPNEQRFTEISAMLASFETQISVLKANGYYQKLLKKYEIE